MMALQATLQHHPLLRATLRSGWRERWSFSGDMLPALRWREGETGGLLPQAEEIDLRREAGLKVYVVQDRSTVDVTFQFHHACCDGAGIDRFTDDLMVHYAGLREFGKSYKFVPTVDPNRLAVRGAYGLSFFRTLKRLPGQLVGLMGAAQFWGRQPIPLLAHQARDRCTKSTKAYPALTSFLLDPSQTLALRKAANHRNVTVHELLVCEFFCALWDWQKLYGQYSERHWTRMMIPINLRDASYRSLPALNYVSSIFLDRRGDQGGDRDQLLKGIRAEMEVIKRFQLRYTFLFVLNILNGMPWALKRSVQQDTCKTSVIFSSAGKTTRRCPLPRRDGFLHVADLVLRDIDGLAPLRPYNCVTMFTLEYANRLKLNLHYDAEFVSEKQSDVLMDLFVAGLNQVADTAGTQL
ncbi:condensation domain-containing protein [Novipirellula artificiosorum]|uniref:Condensation domain protein n=1 Tax=Novipirellula artificiosorum TaxID=2528016 RepID=A0A5C6D7G7_9BACT|nr:hypothetical protein [Novipirellula artificiosorum]TWU31995.1 Condensation domain protein [Novipirellula artificiosorum]